MVLYIDTVMCCMFLLFHHSIYVQPPNLSFSKGICVIRNQRGR